MRVQRCNGPGWSSPGGLSGCPIFRDIVGMKQTLTHRGYRYPADIIAPAHPCAREFGASMPIIAHAAWLYHRFALSPRDIEDVLG